MPVGIMSGFTGNAGDIPPHEAVAEFAGLMGQGEGIHAAYRLVRDAIVFTHWRLMLIDKQGLTGKKCEYHSIPYKNISHFAVETAGHMDGDAELKIWVGDREDPTFHLEFSRSVDIYKIQAMLTQFVVAR